MVSLNWDGPLNAQTGWRRSAAVLGGLIQTGPAGISRSVKDSIGTALSIAQFGGKHPAAKPWKGEGSGVLEVVENHGGDAYRAVYTVRFQQAVYVLHCFQKKSHIGIQTPRPDVELVSRRLKLVTQDHKDRHGEIKRGT